MGSLKTKNPTSAVLATVGWHGGKTKTEERRATSYNSGYTKCLPQAQHRHFA
ncbi:MAG: hypothetical protein GX556_18455 [Fibrobacter sp.]|nr:hypothetical protein [Fibrobacter sp.]